MNSSVLWSLLSQIILVWPHPKLIFSGPVLSGHFTIPQGCPLNTGLTVYLLLSIIFSLLIFRSASRKTPENTHFAVLRLSHTHARTHARTHRLVLFVWNSLCLTRGETKAFFAGMNHNGLVFWNLAVLLIMTCSFSWCHGVHLFGWRNLIYAN